MFNTVSVPEPLYLVSQLSLWGTSAIGHVLLLDASWLKDIIIEEDHQRFATPDANLRVFAH